MNARPRSPQTFSVTALLAVAAVPTAIGIAGLFPREPALALGVMFALAAGSQAALARLSLGRERRRADRMILAGRRTENLSWRLEELTSPTERRSLARAVRRLVRTLDGRYLPGASPVNRPAARPLVARFEALAARLADVERPVDPRGVVLVERLLADGSSPLYSNERAGELPRSLDDAFTALGGSVGGRNGFQPRPDGDRTPGAEDGR
jgi:hypothetical protein